MIGRQLGGYEIISEIGRGGMGVVYRARQLSLDREVALKTLMPGLALDETLVERFEAEARAASRINHPNLVPVYDVGREQDVHYLAMEFVEGQDLATLLHRDGPTDYPEAAAIASQAAAGLGALHRAGVVHRDVKPSNVLVRPDGVVKVTDFGVALLQGAAARLTAEGSTVGTATYMSPEQVRGEELDGRSDVYSLGIVLYQMLTGAPPFVADAPLVVMRQHCEEEPPSIRRARPDVPDRLAQVVARCLAKSPDDRYQTAEALAGDLDHVRLELEFDALQADPTAAGTTALYSTRTVASLQQLHTDGLGPVGRLRRRVAGVALGLWRYCAGTLDRQEMALRRAAERMEQALMQLAEAKRTRSELAARADEMRRRADAARRDSAAAFDADQTARAEELAEEEKRCDAAVIDYDRAAADLVPAVREAEAHYKEARDEHERLRIKMDLRKAEAVRAAVGGRPPRSRRAALAVAVACAVAVAVVLLWPQSGRPGPASDAEAADVTDGPLPEPAGWDEETRGTIVATVDGDVMMDIRYYRNSIGMDLALVPAGEFVTGGNATESASSPPMHVTFTEPFYMSAYEVTQEHYELVMGTNPSRFVDPQRPVDTVERMDAVEFCRRLSQMDGHSYRIPDEVEWEYACRAGSPWPYYWGATMRDDCAWHLYNSGRESHPVGLTVPNRFGLYDMSGNLWEWCVRNESAARGLDRIVVTPSTVSVAATPGAVRGGSWYRTPARARSDSRLGSIPPAATWGLGWSQ